MNNVVRMTNSELSAALDVVDRALIAGIITREGLNARFNLFTGTGNRETRTDDREERDSKDVLNAIHVILQSDAPSLSANAGKFIAETMVRARKYDKTKFTPKQASWFDNLYQTAEDASRVSEEPPF